jgi:hypothetical protein
MNWQLLVTKSARPQIGKLSSKDQLRIEAAVDALQRDPFSGDIKRLQSPEWRRGLEITGFYSFLKNISLS